MNNNTVVITQHQALVQYLVEQGIIDPSQGVDVISHATADDVTGRHVVGVLPIHLAALAENYTNVALFIPQELRGVELNIEQVRLYAQPAVTYRVMVVS